MNFPKQPRIRLKGKALEQLNKNIHERDDYKCIVCGRFVALGEKFHHEPPKSQGGNDIEENGVLLCMSCHNERHFGEDSQEIRYKALEYLGKVYE